MTRILFNYKMPKIIAGLFLVILLGIFFSSKVKTLIYPQLHRNQESPVAYINEHQNKVASSGAKISVIEHGSRDKHQIALTFDADMTPSMLVLLQKGFVKSWYNAEIKNILDRENVKATVFLGGLWTKTYPFQAKALADDPLIEIGNHSYNHYAFASGCYSLPTISDSESSDDVAAAQKIITVTTGKAPKYFRFPGGCYDRIDLETIYKLGLKIVHWDISAGDGFNNNVLSIVNQIESHAQNGSIVVMHIHDGTYAPKTHEAVAKIIPDLKKQGYKFVTISEMIAQD